MAKAKGTTLIGAVRFLRTRKEEARAALVPELHHYLEERIHPSSWYPEEDLLALVEAMLPMIPGARSEVLATMGAQTAREHMEGVYAHLSAAGDAASRARRAFALWSSQHDTGRMEVSSIGPGETRMTVHEFGLPSEAMCGIFTGYFAETLRIEGAHQVAVQKEECVLRGDPCCSWRLTHGKR